MSLKATIQAARKLAYEEGADQIVGKIDGDWAIANTEDAGRIASMESATTFCVHGHGADAGDFMAAMERMGIDGDQDWQAETTTYDVEGEQIVVSGPSVG